MFDFLLSSQRLEDTCASASISITRLRRFSSQLEKCTAVVDLPTPPSLFMNAIVGMLV